MKKIAMLISIFILTLIPSVFGAEYREFHETRSGGNSSMQPGFAEKEIRTEIHCRKCIGKQGKNVLSHKRSVNSMLSIKSSAEISATLRLSSSGMQAVTFKSGWVRAMSRARSP